MSDVLVVGSGATGVHFAQTALERDHRVTMLDVGFQPEPPVLPEANFLELPGQLEDPLAYFLGELGAGVVTPSRAAKPYGFPPSKAYVFRRPAGWQLDERGFQPLVSFARGGLAEAWTGGSYELTDEEFADFPFAASEIREAYARVARRIGISATDDDLSAFAPFTAGSLPPSELDAHSRDLLDRYAERRAHLRARGVVLGRSRVALLTRDRHGRGACTSLGRCLWGCPHGALYAPSHTLAELLRDPRFTYRAGTFVRRVLVGARGIVRGVAVAGSGTSGEAELRADRVVLAAGALATTQIYLCTLEAMGMRDPALPGLMDNRHVSIPFVNVRRLGAAAELARYQFHQIAVALQGSHWREHVHGQLTTLKSAAVHPIVSAMPFDLHTSLAVFRRIRGALGVANIWLSDSRSDGNVARLGSGGGEGKRLVVEYATDSRDARRTHEAIARTRQALRSLGCFAPAGQVQVLPRGSSVHYAGTLPMTAEGSQHTCAPDGAVRGFQGLFVVDGAGFPWLPAKNVTFTLMANAVRIAERMLGD